MKSILFNDEMVRATLAGLKTKTRRPLKPQPRILPFPFDDEVIVHLLPPSSDCPFGQIGDRLWVRETWYPAFSRAESDNGCVYKADYGARPDLAREWVPCSSKKGGGWKPSIHMPRWASRITLEITDIRVERVQEITEEEAKAEGVLPCPHPLSKDDECLDCYLDAGEYACAFLNLWNRLYAKQGLGVDVNPWVWVIGFRRVEE